MLDIIHRVDKNHKVQYVWFDTGIEYEATKEHLKYLEEKYDIKIQRIKAIKPIPTACKEYGQPFLSKFVSEMMGRLQKHGFQWEDDTYENLAEKYPKCKGSIAWWTNHRDVTKYGYSMFNINYNRFLKEFIIQNPPAFRISQKCCTFAKKDVAKNYIKEHNTDLSIIGVRKSEGGIRSAKYKSCFEDNYDELSFYRPLLWYKNKDEDAYDEMFGLTHSDCYEVYGMTRTGCVGCPYNKHIIQELEVMEQYEPNLAEAARNIFKDSYEYTMKYRAFVKEMKLKDKANKVLQEESK